jgi:hypothetical protein
MRPQWSLAADDHERPHRPYVLGIGTRSAALRAEADMRGKPLPSEHARHSLRS